MSKPDALQRGHRRVSSPRQPLPWGAAFALVASLLVLIPASAQEPSPLRMQAPAAQSVGTTTNLKAASQTLLQRFDALSKDQRQISFLDLVAERRPASAGRRDAVQDAVRFFIVSPIARRLAGEGGGKGLTRAGLERAAKAATNPKLDELLLSWVDPRNGVRPRLRADLLSDPGVPDGVRKRLLTHFDDRQLLDLIGHPNVQGNDRDKHDETTAFLFLIRMSWLGAAEAEAIARYRVPYVMARGKDDKGVSYWDGRKVLLSEVMLAGRKGAPVDAKELVKHIGTFAHESGHALYALSGTQKKFEADTKRHGLDRTPGTRGINGIVNEGMAGVFQNRAHIAAQGFGKNRESDDHLSLDNDIANNLADDKRVYAKYYHVDTREARAELPAVRPLIANDLIPWFETQFRLLDDPQLTLNLPSAR